MHIDRALVDIDVAAPHAVEQLLAAKTRGRDAPSGIRAGGTRSGPDGPRGRRARRAASRDRARDRRRLSTLGDPLRAGAAQQRAHARQQFRHRERLDDVVVGAGREAAHALALLAARGQHDDRQRCGLAAARAAGGRARCRTGRAASSRAPGDRARFPSSADVGLVAARRRCRPRSLRLRDCSAAAAISGSSSSTIRMRAAHRRSRYSLQYALAAKTSWCRPSAARR